MTGLFAQTSNAPVWLTQRVQELILKRVPDTVLVDQDIGVLLNSFAQDRDTQSASVFLKKNCSALIFGNILLETVAKDREKIVRSMTRRLARVLSDPVEVFVSAMVEKETDRRGFKVKLQDKNKKLTATIYIEKKADDWKFLDIQDIKEIVAGSAVDKAASRTRLELEGWIPHGY